MKKYIVALCMILLMSFTNFITTMAYTEGYFEYEVSDQSVTITGYFGKETEVTVPSAIAGNPVNTIAKGAFMDTPVKTLNLPDTIMTIESGAIDINVKVVYDSNVEEPVTPKDESTEDDEGDASVNSPEDMDSDSQDVSDTNKTDNEANADNADNSTDEDTIEETEIELDDEEVQDTASEKKVQNSIWLIITVITVLGSCIGVFLLKRRKK